MCHDNNPNEDYIVFDDLLVQEIHRLLQSQIEEEIEIDRQIDIHEQRDIELRMTEVFSRLSFPL